MATHPMLGKVHHWGYAVEDLEATAEMLGATLGAGPFFLLGRPPIENVRSRGEPAVFGHTAAFGQCGDTPIELLAIDHCEPARVREAFTRGPLPHVHHAAVVVPSLAEASARLERAGQPEFLRAELGDIALVFHDASAALGHHLELHVDSAGFRGFFAMLREASEGWDGSDPIRSLAL